MLKRKDPDKTPIIAPACPPSEIPAIAPQFKKFNLDDPEQLKAFIRSQDEYDYLDDLPVKTVAALNPDILNHGYPGSLYMLYTAICSRVDVGEFFVATQQMMAELARMSLQTARVYIPVLMCDGWIELVRKYDGFSPRAYKRLK